MQAPQLVQQQPISLPCFTPPPSTPTLASAPTPAPLPAPAPASTTSQLQNPSTSPFSQPIAALQRIHDRILSVTEAVQWLMARDAHSDFHVVRNDSAVLITIQPAAPAQITPTPPTSLPFPESDDLTFLDRTFGNFAFGHVSLQTQFLPSMLPALFLFSFSIPNSLQLSYLTERVNMLISNIDIGLG